MIVGLVICLLAAAALIVAISFTAVAKSGGKLSGRTTGKIVDITYAPRYFNGESNSPTDGATIGDTNQQQHMAATVFSYFVNGQEYRRATNYLINEFMAQKKIGQTCNVRFDPQNPQKASIAKGNTYKIVAIILYIVAAVLLLFGVMFMIIL
ncbi:MAG: DUF3592 domain-containing protein [Lachnospiraceae bacterium]|nr:DUF3592 domain-containing protein [Lachnospiraceae bacterium]